MSWRYFMSLPVSLHITANAVANMAAGKRRLASRRGLAYTELNSAAAVKAASRGVAAVLERVRIATGSCCERVLLATGCTVGTGVGVGLGGGGGGGAGAVSAVGAAGCCTLGCAFSTVNAGGVEAAAGCVCCPRTRSSTRDILLVNGRASFLLADVSATLGDWAAARVWLRVIGR